MTFLQILFVVMALFATCGDIYFNKRGCEVLPWAVVTCLVLALFVHR